MWAGDGKAGQGAASKTPALRPLECYAPEATWRRQNLLVSPQPTCLPLIQLCHLGHYLTLALWPSQGAFLEGALEGLTHLFGWYSDQEAKERRPRSTWGFWPPIQGAGHLSWDKLLCCPDLTDPWPRRSKSPGSIPELQQDQAFRTEVTELLVNPLGHCSGCCLARDRNGVGERVCMDS